MDIKIGNKVKTTAKWDNHRTPISGTVTGFKTIKFNKTVMVEDPRSGFLFMREEVPTTVEYSTVVVLDNGEEINESHLELDDSDRVKFESEEPGTSMSTYLENIKTSGKVDCIIKLKNPPIFIDHRKYSSGHMMILGKSSAMTEENKEAYRKYLETIKEMCVGLDCEKKE